MEAVVGVLVVVVVLLSVLVVGLLRSHAVILRALASLGVDLSEITDPAPVRRREGVRPAFPVAGAALRGGDPVHIATDTAPRTLLAFLSSSCLTCRPFWDGLRERDDDLPAGIRLVVVTHDAAAEDVERLHALAGEELDVVHSSAAWSDYEIPGSPYFVLVERERGVVGEGTGPDWPQVRRLLAFDGVTTAVPAPKRRRLDPRDDSARIDEELWAAGLRPGDPSLYEGS